MTDIKQLLCKAYGDISETEDCIDFVNEFTKKCLIYFLRSTGPAQKAKYGGMYDAGVFLGYMLSGTLRSS